MNEHRPTLSKSLDENPIDLKGLIQILKTNWRLIAGVTLFFLVLGILYSFTEHPIYQSSALIQVNGNQNSTSGLLQSLGLNNQQDPSALNSIFSGQASPADVETALIKSRFIAGEVINELGLNIEASPHLFPFIGRLTTALYQGKKPAAPFLGLSRYDWGGSSIELSKLTVPNYLHDVPFTVVTEKQGAYTLKAPNGTVILQGKTGELVKSKNPHYPITIKISALKARPGTEFSVYNKAPATVLGGFLGGLNIVPQGKKTGILKLTYTSGNPTESQLILNTILTVAVAKNTAEKAAEASKTLEFLKHQLPGLNEKLSNAEKALINYQTKTGAVGSKIEEQILLQNVSALEQSIETLKQKKLQLLQRFTPQHPFVIAINKQIKQVEDVENRLQKKLRDIPSINQPTVNLSRHVQITSGLYLDMMQTLQQMQMLKGSTLSDVRLLSKATYPVYPLASKKPAIIFGSLILGLFISIFIVLIRHFLQPVVYDPDTLEEALELPVLALLPFSKTQKELSHQLDKPIEPGLPQLTRLLAEHKSRDLTVEGLRSLRTSLSLQMLEAKNNIISISGVSPNLGKSFISANLAWLLVDSGKRVLLIDADMRKGYLHKYFRSEKIPGLSEYLSSEQLSVNDVTRSIIPGKLDFISVGHYPSRPAELLLTSRFTDLLEQASAQYDHVIIDTSPVLAVTDSAIILKHTATNLLVVGSGVNHLKEVEHAKGVLTKSGVILHGMILNHLQASSDKQYGYGKYNYYYSDYYSEEKPTSKKKTKSRTGIEA